MRVAGRLAMLFAAWPLAFPAAALSQSPAVMIERMTWTEVREAIDAGKSTAIIIAGSTERNGPHLSLGKHNVVAAHVASLIAGELGDALAYPVVPFAPAGDPDSGTGHMRYPGTVSLSESSFGAVVRDVALSARAAGFKHIMLMGDHGGGQEVLGRVAASLDSQYAAGGTRVRYVPDLYFKAKAEMKRYLADHDLPPDVHAGIDDTSELLFLDRDSVWVRRELLSAVRAGSGVPKGSHRASAELGRLFLGMKVANAVHQIRLFRQRE